MRDISQEDQVWIASLKENGALTHAQIANKFNKKHKLKGKLRLRPTQVKSLLKSVLSLHHKKIAERKADFNAIFDDIDN